MFTPGLDIEILMPEWIPSQDPREPTTMRVGLRQAENQEVIHFRFTGVGHSKPPLALEAVLPLALIPAMKLGSALRFPQPVSRTLLEGAARFQEIFSVWYPEFSRVAIHATAHDDHAPAPTSEGTGLFFSGGLDSSYSLLKHRHDLTHAILIHGCDIPLHNKSYWETTVQRLSETSRSLGIRLITVETDLLGFSDPFCHWGYHYHGAALAAMGMMMSGSVRRVYVASSTSYLRIVPWGSSIVTDPLWSSAQLEVIHDGAEKERLGKTETLIQFPVALRNLRVCFETPEGGYNCGRCEKCYRNMVALRLCGALESSGAFDRALDLEAMVDHPEVCQKFGQLRSWMLNRETARRLGTDPELIQALDEIHRRSAYLHAIQLLAREKNDIIASPFWRASLPKFRTALLHSLRTADPAWFVDRIVQWLPAERDRALIRLAEHDRPWFRRAVRRHRLRRLLRRLAAALRRAGIQLNRLG